MVLLRNNIVVVVEVHDDAFLLLTFSLVPVARQTIKHVGNLAIVFILVDGPQISHHQICDTQGLGPGTGDFDIGEICLLACRVAVRGRTWVERWQLLR